MPDTGPIRLLYIISVSYSGSTLLDLLLSSHSQVGSVGEAKSFTTGRTECTCDSRDVWRCPFWGRVDEELRRRSGLVLRSLRLDASGDEEFAAHNRAFFEAVRAVDGRSWIVDSSKDVRRLERLLETAALPVVPIHLIRHPEGVVYSHVKKHPRWVLPAIRYGRRRSQTQAILRRRTAIRIRYEDLARSPETSLTGILTRLGLVFEPEQLDWVGRERHNVGGSRMRWSTDGRIRPDEGWRRVLPYWQRAAIHGLVHLGTLSGSLPINFRLASGRAARG